MADTVAKWTIGEKMFVLDEKNGPKLNGRIVDVNLPKRLVKLRFIGWNPKPDEWFSMDSTLLQRSTKSSSPKKSPVRGTTRNGKFAVGQQVLGAWSDGVWYPGVISEVRSAGSVVIHFYDGLKKALRVNLVRAVSIEEYQKRLADVLKTAEEMDRSLIQANTVTLGRTRRQDQVVRTPSTEVPKPVPAPPPQVSNNSNNLDQPSVSNSTPNNEAIPLDPDSDVDDTPLSVFAAKRARRISPRIASAPVSKPREEQVNTRPLRSSVSKTTPTVAVESSSEPPVKRASSRQSQRKSVPPASEATSTTPSERPQSSSAVEISSKLRRKLPNHSNATPSAAPSSTSNGTGLSQAAVPQAHQQLLTIVHCMCGKNRQEPGMLQCSLCMTWQHAGCCLGAAKIGQNNKREITGTGSSDSYVCHFCARPPGAYVDLPQRIRSRALERGIYRRFGTGSVESNGSLLTQLVLQTDAVVGLLRKSRQLISEIANSHRYHEKQTDLIDTINTIHSHAEVLLGKIEDASDAEAERLSNQPSNLDGYQAKKLASLSLRDILSDVSTLSEMLIRAEAVSASSGNSKQNAQQQRSASVVANNKPDLAKP